MMQLNKRDVITIVALCIIFFSIATWNVGLADAPTNAWQGTQTTSFYVDLGSSQQVSEVYFFVRSGNATVDVSIGSPDNWQYAGQFMLRSQSTDYAKFEKITLNANTQYLHFSVQPEVYDSRPNFYWSVPNPTDKEPSPFVEVTEIGVQGADDQKIPIVSLTADNGSDPNLSKLVDEQSGVEIPPTYMSKMYFDEVYFARAAADYLHHVEPLERTHPPLGKLIQAAGIAVIGDTPFGWRFVGVIFATLMIPVMFLIGKKLFGTWIGGFSAAFLLTFDFMHFTMARIGTSDTYVVFFSLMTQLFFLIYSMNVVKHGWKTSVLPLFLAFVFFALGFSTKWLSLYAALGMLAILVAYRIRDSVRLKGGLGAKFAALFDHPFLIMVGFVGVVALIYFLSYVPDMLIGDSFTKIFNLQFEMYHFHSTLVATDSYASSWWSWPFMVSPSGYVPRWFDITYLPNNIDSTISVFGNPAVWWVGFAAILVVTERAIRGKELVQGIKRRLKRKPPVAEGQDQGQVPAEAASALVSEPSVEAPPPIPEAPASEPAPAVEASAPSTGRKWDLAAIYIAVVFFASWLPYVFISRITYIYHFYVSVPLLCLASAYLINKCWNTRKGKIAAVIFFASVVVMFVVFYPVISGAPVPTSYIDKLKWFPSWFFAP